MLCPLLHTATFAQNAYVVPWTGNSGGPMMCRSSMNESKSEYKIGVLCLTPCTYTHIPSPERSSLHLNQNWLPIQEETQMNKKHYQIFLNSSVTSLHQPSTYAENNHIKGKKKVGSTLFLLYSLVTKGNTCWLVECSCIKKWIENNWVSFRPCFYCSCRNQIHIMLNIYAWMSYEIQIV